MAMKFNTPRIFLPTKNMKILPTKFNTRTVFLKVALFNRTLTNETALYNLNEVVHASAILMHIDGFSRHRQIV